MAKTTLAPLRGRSQTRPPPRPVPEDEGIVAAPEPNRGALRCSRPLPNSRTAPPTGLGAGISTSAARCTSRKRLVKQLKISVSQSKARRGRFQSSDSCR